MTYSNKDTSTRKNFPMTIKHDRSLPKDYSGNIFIWDIDGTYLNTDFKNIRSLIKIPFEKGVDKKNIPGSNIILKHIRMGADTKRNSENPIYFITASPPQLENAISDKMTIDGVTPDGITFKDFWGVISEWRFNNLFKQVAYKLSALITNRLNFPKNSSEILFGDNIEMDAEIYSIYDMIFHKDRDINYIRECMELLEAEEPYLSIIINRIKKISPTAKNPVKRIYIHTTDKNKIIKHDFYSKKLFYADNYLLIAIDMYINGFVSLKCISDVYKDMLNYPEITKNELIKSIRDKNKQGIYYNDTVEKIINDLEKY